MRRSTFLGTLAAVAAFPSGARAAEPHVWVGSYSHIDPEWRWPLQEGLQQADSTFRSVLRVLDAFPDLRFSETSAWLYDWVRKSDPATFERIKALVQSGRWEIAGGWWTEPDVNIVSGESLMRQALYGQQFFRTYFGTEAAVAMLPDSFGASANLPAILHAQGFRYFISGRGALGGQIPSGFFTWLSLGDASIVTYANVVPGGTDDAVATVKGGAGLNLGYAPLVWIGLGDHGGGPTLQAMQNLQTYLATPNAPQVRYCRFQEYFAQGGAPRTRHLGEFAAVFPGAFTNAHAMKRANAEAERALLDLERFDVLATLAGIDAPLPQLDTEWRTLLGHQHHDTISGTTIPENLERAVEDVRGVQARAERETAAVLERVVDRIAHSDGDDGMLVVFNPLCRPVDTVLSYPLRSLESTVPTLFGVRGKINAQPAYADDPVYDINPPETLFRVSIPALGYTTLRVRGDTDAPALPKEAVPRSITNGTCIATLDPVSQLPAALTDDRTRAAFPNPRFVVVADHEDTWGSRGLSSEPRIATFDLVSSRLVEDGPLRWTIRSSFVFRSSRFDVTMQMLAGESAIRLGIDADWNEQFMRAGLSFDLGGTDALYEIPFGVVSRGASVQLQPALRFVARTVNGGLAGLASLGNHGFWTSTTTTGVTLVRSTPYSALDAVPKKPTRVLDQGHTRHDLLLALAPDAAQLAAAVDVFCRPFPVVWSGVHPGTLDAERGYATASAGTEVASLRRVVDAIEVRAHNRMPQRNAVRISVGTNSTGATLPAYGIETLRLAGDRFETYPQA